MAEAQKPVENLAEETAPAVTEAAPVAEAKPEANPLETSAAITEPVLDTKPAETTEAVAPDAETAAAAAAEEVKEPAKPIEEGTLEYKGQGTNFPKNLIFSKKLFWFGVDAVDLKAVPSFKGDKHADVAHHVVAWASETGKGLLFFGEKDKATPQGAVQLAEATEPATEGTLKFHFTAKGNKHSFRASTTAERDSWVSQLKLKISEAKDLATTVVESETYKKTLETLKPAPVKHEEKVSVPEPSTTVPATEEAGAVATEATSVEEAPAAEATKDEKKEEPKRRSASRKRASVFGSIFSGNKKDDEKKAAESEAPVAPVTDVAAIAAAPTATETTDLPATETTSPPAVEESRVEDKKEEAPKTAKRQSLFGNLSFNRKKATEVDATPKEAAPAPIEAVAETAPVIPAVEATEPLSAEVVSPATVPTETTNVSSATNGEAKKEVRNDKRKSSLPFVFGGKKEKPSSDEEGEKVKSPGPFSKLRATIKGKGKAPTDKAGEKSEDLPPLPTNSAAAELSTEAAAREEAKPAEASELSAPAPVTEETPAPKVESTPAVTAAA